MVYEKKKQLTNKRTAAKPTALAMLKGPKEIPNNLKT